jgi:hypothetical protein
LLHHCGAAVIFKNKIMILGGVGSDQIEEYDTEKAEWQLSSMCCFSTVKVAGLFSLITSRPSNILEIIYN